MLDLEFDWLVGCVNGVWEDYGCKGILGLNS